MKSRRKELLGIVERLQGASVAVIGDLILDHYTWGKVNRISPEAPVVIVHVTEESKRPGGAGNVASNLAALGGKASIFGVVGDDDAGRSLLSLMSEAGIDVEGVLVDRARPTTVKTRVIAHAQQIVRVDREVLSPLSHAFSEGIAAAVEARARTCGALIISDYAKGTVCRPVFERVERLDAEGVVGLAKLPVIVDPKAPNFASYTRATVIKPNRAEAEAAAGVPIQSRADAIKAGQILLERWNTDLILITLGEEGMVLVSKLKDAEQAVEIETVARDVYDVSGAGDTVSAVFALALAVKASPRQAAELANYAAGVVVAEVGTVAVTREQLIEAIENDLEE